MQNSKKKQEVSVSRDVTGTLNVSGRDTITNHKNIGKHQFIMIEGKPTADDTQPGERKLLEQNMNHFKSAQASENARATVVDNQGIVLLGVIALVAIIAIIGIIIFAPVVAGQTEDRSANSVEETSTPIPSFEQSIIMDLPPTAFVSDTEVLPATEVPSPTPIPVPTPDHTALISCCLDPNLIIEEIEIRSEPLPNSKIIGTLHIGTQVDIIGRSASGGWFCVSTIRGEEIVVGFIHENNLTFADRSEWWTTLVPNFSCPPG